MTVDRSPRDLKSIFMDRCQPGFTAFRLPLVPLVCILFLHHVYRSHVHGIFSISRRCLREAVIVIDRDGVRAVIGGCTAKARFDIPGVPGRPSSAFYRVRYETHSEAFGGPYYGRMHRWGLPSN